MPFLKRDTGGKWIVQASDFTEKVDITDQDSCGKLLTQWSLTKDKTIQLATLLLNEAQKLS